MKHFFLYLLIVIAVPYYGQNAIIKKLKNIKNVDKAIIEAESILKIAEASNKDTLYLETGIFLASKYNTKSRFKDAKLLIDNCFIKTTRNKFLKQKGYLIIQLASNYKLQSDNAQALDEYFKAHEIFIALKDSSGILRAEIELAECFRRIGDYTEASKWISKSFCLIKSFNKDSSLLLKLYGRAAAIKNETGQGDSAIFLSLKAIKIAKKLKDSLTLGHTLNELGFAYKNKRRPDTSEILYKQAEDIYRKYGDDYNLIHVMNNRAMLYAHNSYPKKTVKKIYFEIIHLVEDKKLNFDLSSVYINLCTREIITNDSNKAFVYFRKYHECVLKSTIANRETEISKIKEKYDNESIKKDMAIVADKLNLTETNLEQKQRQNRTVIISLAILVLFLAIIIILAYRLNSSNKELAKKNKEKDALVQEVHHRVKNNLQLTNAMLKMQLNSISDEHKKEDLKETSRRINAMSLVHEMLYNKDSSEYVVLKEYLIELIEKLKDLISNKSKPIIFHLQLNNDIKFNTTQGVAIGMITSEIISNSIKYAFNDTLKPEISINLNVDFLEKTIIYNIKDNGCGFNATIKKEGFGSRLIDIFARQIEAEYTIKNVGGVEYEFIIPYLKNDK
jgi:two-component sensor histidine kinase